MATNVSTAGRLDTGVVSSTARRQTAWLLAGAALVWRLPALLQILRGDRVALQATVEALVPIPFTHDGFGVGAFLSSPEIAWVGSPLYLVMVAIDAGLHAHGITLLVLQALLSVLLVVAVFRLGEKWVGHRGAVTAAIACALCAQELAATAALGPSLAVSLGCLGLAGSLGRIHPRSEPRAALRLGMGMGLLTTLTGLGVAWGVLTAAWLPTRGKAFRRLRYLAALGYLVAGAVAVLSPVLLRNALTQRDLVAPWSNAPFELYTGLTTTATIPPPDLAHAEDPMAKRQYATLVLARQRPAAAGRDAARGWAWLRMAGAGLAGHPGRVVGTVARRALGFLGGAHDSAAPSRAPVPSRRGLPALPLGAITAVAWLGFFALLGSWRAYVPLYACALLPLLCASLTGVTPGWQLVALPAHALLAGYGVARVIEARRTLSTWLVALPLLAGGVAVVAWF